MQERREVIGPAQLSLGEIKEKCKDLKTLRFYDFAISGTESALIMREWVRVAGDDSKGWYVDFVASEMFKNAYIWGNEGKFWKKIEVYCGWVNDVFYCVIKDQGKGFDINNPVYHAESEGGGITGSKWRVDALYNFGDNASYFCVKKP